MRRLLTSWLALTLCLLANNVFAQTGNEIRWKHSFTGTEINANNYTSPISLTDDNQGSPLTWNFNVDWQTQDTYFGNGGDCIQIGSANKPASSFELSTDGIIGKVKEVNIVTYGALKISGGSVAVTIGTESLGSYIFTNLPAEYSFSNSNAAAGLIKISFSQNSTVAIYLVSIEIVYESDPYAIITIGESGYATYVSSNALDFSQVTDADDQPAVIVAYVVPVYYSNSQVGLLRTGGDSNCDDRTVAANTGIVVKGAAGTYHVNYSDEPGNYFGNLLKPVIGTIILEPTDGDYTNFVLTADGFRPLSQAGSFGPNKAYLQIPTSFVTSHNITSFNFVEIEDVSGIEEAKTNQSAGQWYTIDGIRIDKPTQKGIYLHNGKKMVIK